MENNKTKVTIIRLSSNNQYIDNNDQYLINVDELINEKSGIRNKFHISDYQRPYCWNKTQIIELLDDIYQSVDIKEHFTGTLYFGSDDSTDAGLSIIDGQQRLISIFITLAALKEYDSQIKNFDIRIKFNKTYQNIDDFLTLDKRHLTNLKQTNNLYKDYIDNILRNKKEVLKYFESKKIDKEDFLKKILNNIYFVVIKCEDKQMENTFFRIINAKGQMLDDIDKIKSFLLSKFYIHNADIEKFQGLWCSLNKKGKKSINSFFKLLMNDLSNKKTSGKIKYKNFIKSIEKIPSEDFKKNFENAIERFEYLPSDFSKIEDEQLNNESTNEWKNIQACCYLCYKSGFKDKILSEIGCKENFEKYKNGELNPIILFMLYLFSYICKANYSFGGYDGNQIINEFQSLKTDKERKERLKVLFHEFKNKNKIDEIQYKINEINGNDKKINRKNNLILPLLCLSNCYQTKDFYRTLKEWYLKDPTKDHIMPKKIKKTSIDAEDRSLKFNEFVEKIDKRTMEKISTSIGNIQILSRGGNSTKSNKIPIKYCEYDELNKCIAIKLDDALQDIDKNKNTIVNNIEYLINKI